MTYIILKVKEKQGSIVSLEDTFLEKSQRWGLKLTQPPFSPHPPIPAIYGLKTMKAL